MPPILLNVLIALIPLLSVVAALVLLWKQRGLFRALALVPLLVCAGIFIAIGHSIGTLLNPVANSSPAVVSAEALVLHRAAGAIDLHADPLLFGRDLLERSTAGHVDVPRLLEGGVAVQVFSLVTRIPLGYNEVATDADRPDIITLVGMTHFWPPATWFNLHERVVYHARRLQEMATRSQGKLRLLRDRDDLTSVLAARARGEAVVGGLFAIEGAHVLSNDFDAELEVLFDEGLRMASLTHFFDTKFGGSVQGLHKGGLTAKGRELVAALEKRGIAVDLAHASHPTIEDVLAVATRPVLFSHTGVAATCDQFHNLQDDHIRAIAANGGVMGIGLWDTAVCGTTAADTVKAMKHVIDLVGDAHVAIGSDFDGYVRAHFDAAGLPALTQAMLDASFPEATIRRILSGNAIRVLRATLPRGSE